MSKLVQIQYDTNCYGSCDFQTCLNMLKHVQTCSDSIWYELLQFMRFSNMSEPVETCLNLFRFNMIWIDAILKHVWTCSNMSKLVQIQYDMNCYDSYDSHRYLNMFKQTCQNLFRFNMIRIVTIHMILKHVWTCSESIWHESLRFSNMSKLVQNQSDMNWYDSQTCLYIWNMSKLVQNQYDMNFNDS